MKEMARPKNCLWEIANKKKKGKKRANGNTYWVLWQFHGQRSLYIVEGWQPTSQETLQLLLHTPFLSQLPFQSLTQQRLPKSSVTGKKSSQLACKRLDLFLFSVFTCETLVLIVGGIKDKSPNVIDHTRVVLFALSILLFARYLFRFSLIWVLPIY